MLGLEILKRIVQQVNASQSLVEALQVMVTQVGEALQAQACTIYLIDHVTSQFVLTATQGLNPRIVRRIRFSLEKGLVGYIVRREEPVNLEDASIHPDYLYHPEVGEDKYHAFLGVPIIHHKKIFGVFVVQQQEKRKFDAAEEALLVTLSAQLAGAIAHADATGELRELLSIPNSISRERESGVFSGIGSVQGIGIGHAAVIFPLADLDSVPNRKAQDIEQEIKLFEDALRLTQEDIQSISTRLESVLSAGDMDLFGAYIKIIENPNFKEEVIRLIKKRKWAQGALQSVIRKYISQFEAMEDEYLKERASDIKGLGERILSHLQANQPRFVEFSENTILMGEDISASDLAEVPEGKLKGIVSARGSINSHVAILARSLKIPTVMGAKGIAFDKINNSSVVVDGYLGKVYINPTKKIFNDFQKLALEEKKLNENLEKLRDFPAETLDGIKVKLCINTGLTVNASLPLSVGAEGVGLYRTETPFMVKDRFPAEEEQRVIYRQLLQAFAPRPVVMRTLDVGGDKPLPYFPIKEDNPFLGWRGIRITLDHPEVFLIQIRALLRANEELNNLHILFPMISNIQEVEEALRLLKQAFQELQEEGYNINMPPTGVMIEVPSAVYLAKELAKRVEFISIGSNDLIQYLLAVDRSNPRVSSLYDFLHPAVIRALVQVVQAVHSEGKKVSICGEMASDPLAAILLLAMEFDILSMNSSALPRIKWVIRNFSLAQARKILNDILGMEDAAMIRELLLNSLNNAGLSELVRQEK